MNEQEQIFLRLQTGKTAVICELAERLMFLGELSLKLLDDMERRTIIRIKNAEFNYWVSDQDQLSIIEAGIDSAQADFALLRNQLRSALSKKQMKPR